jgi:hypothetical protein
MAGRCTPGQRAPATRTFEHLLTKPPADGADVPTDTGLDDDTVTAIERVWAAGPDPSPTLIAAARHEFELQLDGTHIREAQDRHRAVVQQVIDL